MDGSRDMKVHQRRGLQLQYSSWLYTRKDLDCSLLRGKSEAETREKSSGQKWE
uniref:Uncharacterized protein n=1 Tax=Brassica oleracea TaxID=3712 RepID=A0A3P6G9Z4_BRAOL|nr:unnamed protein product [Brassica oleracea]